MTLTSSIWDNEICKAPKWFLYPDLIQNPTILALGILLLFKEHFRQESLIHMRNLWWCLSCTRPAGLLLLLPFVVPLLEYLHDLPVPTELLACIPFLYHLLNLATGYLQLKPSRKDHQCFLILLLLTTYFYCHLIVYTIDILGCLLCTWIWPLLRLSFLMGQTTSCWPFAWTLILCCITICPRCLFYIRKWSFLGTGLWSFTQWFLK